jgi:hypothetical protein
MFSVGYVSPRGFGGSHSGLAEDSSLLGCDVVSGVVKAFILGLRFYILLSCFTLKVQVLLSLDVVNYLPTDSVAFQKCEYF